MLLTAFDQLRCIFCNRANDNDEVLPEWLEAMTNLFTQLELPEGAIPCGCNNCGMGGGR